MAFQLNKEGNATAPVPESASGIVDPMATENQEVDNGQAKGIRSPNHSTAGITSQALTKPDAGTDVVKPEMLGKVFDFPKLPNEIKNMIFETAAHYNPAVVYAELKVSSDDSDYPKKVRFISGPLQRWSEFRDLRNLSEAIPEFCCFLESKIGQTFKQLGKRPTNALRGNMDILVISLRANAKSINWTAQGVLAGFKYREHGIQEPKARNIGLSLAASALAGMGCQAGCNHRNSSPLCPLKLAMFAKNFSHLENVFVLVKLRPGDVYPTASSARASLKMLMKKMLRESTSPFSSRARAAY